MSVIYRDVKSTRYHHLQKPWNRQQSHQVEFREQPSFMTISRTCLLSVNLRRLRVFQSGGVALLALRCDPISYSDFFLA